MPTLVRILKNWDWPDLLRQTPAEEGIWNDVRFTLDPVAECDYVIVLNHPPQDTTVYCPAQHVWAIMQEPPNEKFARMHHGDVSYARVYTSDAQLVGKRYISAQPALPWHVNRTYDFLLQCDIPKKERRLSWITSNACFFQGHQKRLEFLAYLHEQQLAFDLYGKGFTYIEDKWDGLAPYQYSIVVENFRNDYYWSEKLADCFLAWTVPIYYGCRRITEYFPEDALICIDVDDPMVIDKIRAAIDGNTWSARLDAVAQARQLVLQRYQLFPFLADEIHKHEKDGCTRRHQARPVTMPSQLRPPQTLSETLRQQLLNRLPPSLVKRVKHSMRK